MSRIGKKPISLPKGVEVKLSGRTISVKGPKGTLSRALHGDIDVKVDGQSLTFVPRPEAEDAARFHGLTRTLVNNMVVGVTEGFSRRLKLVGVGYRAASQGKGLSLSLGYSHPVVFDPPAGIELKVDAQTTIVVSGADKEMVGQVAAKIRGFRPPEPYHGKGVRYEDEHIATKVGKAAGKK
ncbi:MAG: 50S ribosomal protein L6 [Deltaproteobacteria bacterium]|nr:50S ribosomal protein L6 [Deltaproteobacteria bacterium]